MSKQATQISLEDRIANLRAERGDQVAVNDIESVVGSLVGGQVHEDVADIASELRELLTYVGQAKDELVGMQPNSLTKRDLPTAANHLDAIVSATEDAANTILSAAETVGDMSEELEGDKATTLSDLSQELFEASSFQDLTGQRITLVTKTLNHLEERLAALAEAIGDDYVEPEYDEAVEKGEDGVVMNDQDLLHGPQLEGEGNSQEDIDAILASFD
ncbi:protein phosphatase CheZ [Yunchengibacter salinarum]|uniref:protein phosphatase CheZ n=1 Tax=Yunchengibacter salinarum TaxID=3133399 RepID=UPI0035B66F02